MSIAADLVVALVMLLHLYFMVLEMFLWEKPAGRRAFGLDADFAARSRSLAANQGLYNGFLAAGLAWGLMAGLTAHPDPSARAVKYFFLGCVLVAGLFGAATVSRKILWIQALPAAIGLALLRLS